ncbi:uncharacterized protein [Coffea arabica]|uniref:Reverse transcriptase domain-containing protein n=1 Tax=Coffea arabica TaxID=13443 RepID=A0A6P6SAX6_COFAR|nr:uncharacterized protein LOC113689324 [Coffea arabica]XP_027062919.1 uncharacterized protein LOC113689329 [Coffea arabica]
MKDMDARMSQMVTAINRVESYVYEKLPSQPEANLRNVSAMTLRSGKEVEGPKVKNPKSKNEEEIEKEIEEEGRIRENPKVTFTPSSPIKSNLPPFPCMLEKTKKVEKEKELLDVFRKVEINIPLLDAIKQIPKYAKFLKDLCTHKKKIRGDERVTVGENVSVILQRKLPPKCEDSGDKETLPVIISAHLSPRQEDNLIRLLRDHKEAIGWSIADIKGISHSLCMHRIRLEDDAKSVRQAQRRLNLLMMEVVKKEIFKLLELRIIFTTSDSPWVNPTQVVPKKAGVTTEENQEGEMVPVRKPTRLRQCIDYRQLNAVTKNDHFPLPFIDKMIERLAGRVYYCFRDDFSGYFQIAIAPEDQEKTTFTCPFCTLAYRRMSLGLCNTLTTFQRCMVNGVFQFAPPRPIAVPPKRKVSKSATLEIGGPSTDAPGPSSSVPSPPPPTDSQYLALRFQPHHMDTRMERMERQMAGVAQNLAQYLHHVGFRPPFPPQS